MHCASCELLIEQKLLEINGVEFVDASMANNVLQIRSRNKITVGMLNKMFSDNGYEFSDKPFEQGVQGRQLFESAFIAAFAIIVFLALSKMGLSSFASIGSTSSLGAFFVFGLIAGVSTCAALVGGLVLSLSKQWLDLYGGDRSNFQNSKPHFLFNAGRLVSYAIVGGLLGLLGEKIRISAAFSTFLILLVSAAMLVLALQMLGVKWFDRFRLALPKSLSGQVANNQNRTGILTPFIVGFFTFLLPCGFTLAAEGIAVLSGNPFKGSLIMFSFALGTAIPLLAIGLSSAKLIASPKTSEKFLKVAGILIIFFVLYNLNFQFGLTNYLTAKEQTVDHTSQIGTGVDKDAQLIKAVYSQSNDIQPSTFEVKVGQPVRFEVAALDDGTGCMSTIMIPGLWNNPQPLRKGQTIVMEFTPQKTGTFQITCAMGVPRGAITVVD